MTPLPPIDDTDETPVAAAITVAPLALRAPEAAKALGISERALWTATNAGQVPHVKVGRVTLYPVRALEEWLADRAKKSVRRPAKETS